MSFVIVMSSTKGGQTDFQFWDIVVAALAALDTSWSLTNSVGGIDFVSPRGYVVRPWSLRQNPRRQKY